MRIIYLCGPINGCTDEEAHGWRNAVTARLGTLYEVVNPMWRDYRGQEAGNEGRIVRDDLTDIRGADILLVNAFRPSWGTAMELYEAATSNRHNVYAFGAGPNPSPWLVVHCDELFQTLNDALEFLERAA